MKTSEARLSKTIKLNRANIMGSSSVTAKRVNAPLESVLASELTGIEE